MAQENLRANYLYKDQQPDRWDGTQDDPPHRNTSRMRPVDQPPCENNKYANGPVEGAYIETYRDRFDNEYTVDQPMHREATAGEGQSGRLMFADGSDSAGSKPDDLSGFVEIPYGQGAAFQTASTVIVSVDRADRGKES